MPKRKPAIKPIDIEGLDAPMLHPTMIPKGRYQSWNGYSYVPSHTDKKPSLLETITINANIGYKRRKEYPEEYAWLLWYEYDNRNNPQHRHLTP